MLSDLVSQGPRAPVAIRSLGTYICEACCCLPNIAIPSLWLVLIPLLTLCSGRSMASLSVLFGQVSEIVPSLG